MNSCVYKGFLMLLNSTSKNLHIFIYFKASVVVPITLENSGPE